MRFMASAIGIGVAALAAASPCLALTIQSEPPRPDIAQHLRAQAPSVSSGLPAPIDLIQNSSGRLQQQGQGFTSPAAPAGTTTFSFGPLHATTTVTPDYGPYWNGATSRDGG